MDRDKQYMLRCIELSRLGLRAAAPNPSVGCVIVHDGELIGEGYTSAYGGNHAEVNAIKSVQNKALLKNSTVYVSLEPCAHHGKTPPCADLLVSSNVQRVVIGSVDPFAKVNGAGIDRLKSAGVQVEVGVLESECLDSHKRFMAFHQKKRPYVILKWAETSDGFVDRIRQADEKPLQITDHIASTLVHKWRAEEHAILVGKNTALKDDPKLTVRHTDGLNPIRILLDSQGIVPHAARIFDSDSETIVFTTNEDYENENATIVCIAELSVNSILAELYERGISSLFVEGGPSVHRSFYESGHWDEIRQLVSKDSIGAGIPSVKIDRKPTETTQIGTNTLKVYQNR